VHGHAARRGCTAVFHTHPPTRATLTAVPHPPIPPVDKQHTQAGDLRRPHVPRAGHSDGCWRDRSRLLLSAASRAAKEETARALARGETWKAGGSSSRTGAETGCTAAWMMDVAEAGGRRLPASPRHTQATPQRTKPWLLSHALVSSSLITTHTHTRDTHTHTQIPRPDVDPEAYQKALARTRQAQCVQRAIGYMRAGESARWVGA
jgi:hypothetical protein